MIYKYLNIKMDYVGFKLFASHFRIIRIFEVTKNTADVDVSSLRDCPIYGIFLDIAKECNKKRLYKNKGFCGYILNNYIYDIINEDYQLKPTVEGLEVKIVGNMSKKVRAYYYDLIKSAFLDYLSTTTDVIPNKEYIINDIKEYEKRKL